jgi:hypothetical protein
MLFNNIRPITKRIFNMLQRIVISITFFFIILSYNNLFAAQIKITFDPSPDPRAIGHKIFYGKSTNFSNVEDLGSATTYLTPDLEEEVLYYFAAKAYDKYGNESAFSNILSYKIPKKTQTSDSEIENGTNNFSSFREDFQNYSVGDAPSDWLNTGYNNSMIENSGLFEVFGIGNDNVFGTTSTLNNIHSHYIGQNSAELSSLPSFEYAGRMIITDSGGGIGVTFLSQYPVNDAYYRLRSINNNSFHIAAHPHGKELSGIIDSNIIPKVNEWYQFRIKVQILDNRTEILAKVWPKYEVEPVDWQIDAYDDASDRFVDGTFGVWSYGAGSKFWDDLSVTSDIFDYSYSTEFREDFQNYSVGDAPSDWLNTGYNNSMIENSGLFEVFGIGNDNVFGTTSTLNNIHSHYIGQNSAELSSLPSFEYAGRMIITDSGGGIGVTFLSQYPVNDAYYRLRSINNNSFHIAAHPHGKELSGIIDSNIIPKVNEWYQFRIKVQILDNRTEILAKVWPKYEVEPVDWQINAYDDASDRFVDGTFGVWSYGTGSKFWDDLKLFQ